jgi:hypothetical protein
MTYTDQQLKNVVLGHLLDFQFYFAKAKIIATNDDINLLKHKLLVLLEDCYLVISLYKEQQDNKEENKDSEDNKRDELNRIREIEETVANMELIGDSLKDMEEIYDQVLEVFKKYLFT